MNSILAIAALTFSILLVNVSIHSVHALRLQRLDATPSNTLHASVIQALLWHARCSFSLLSLIRNKVDEWENEEWEKDADDDLKVKQVLVWYTNN